MAVPRIFISSTCYDMAEIRDSLTSFCQGFGFETVLSDRGDVFYHPDLHTHEACVGEVANCHMLVLVVGGRFGGTYIADKSKSITNAEYEAARAQNVPVFAFVKQDVLNDHNVWQKNKDKAFSKEIAYPSIERQEHALDIFNFIDVVRLSEVNNGFFGFRVARDLEDLLRKQIAGMFFDFLTRRNISKQIQSTSDAVNSLTVVSNTIEELVKSMYRKLTDGGAEEVIKSLDNVAKAEYFFVEIARLIGDKSFVLRGCIEQALALNSVDWRDGLVATGLFQYGFNEERLRQRPSTQMIVIPPNSERVLTYLGVRPISDADGSVIDRDAETVIRLQTSWSIFRTLSDDSRRQIYLRYAYQPKE
jgi:hypothetical protein